MAMFTTAYEKIKSNVSRWWAGHGEDIKKLLYGIIFGFVVWAILVSFIMFCYGVYNDRGTVPDIDESVQRIEAEQSTAIGKLETIQTGIAGSQADVERIESNQQSIIESVGRIEDTVRDNGERINWIERKIDNAIGIIDSSEGVIAGSEHGITECERILADIKRTGKQTE